MFQISLENFTTASIQQTSLVPSESNETVSIVATENAHSHIKAAGTQLDDGAISCVSDNRESSATSNVKSVQKVPIKRSPGRPRKDVSSLTSNVSSILLLTSQCINTQWRMSNSLIAFLCRVLAK